MKLRQFYLLLALITGMSTLSHAQNSLPDKKLQNKIDLKQMRFISDLLRARQRPVSLKLGSSVQTKEMANLVMQLDKLNTIK